MVTVSRKGHKQVDFLKSSFLRLFFTPKTIFQDEPTYPKPRKCCFLQLKLGMFTFYPKIASRKKTPQNTTKMVQNQVLKPEKWAYCLGEMLGYEKDVFLKQNQKPDFWPRKKGKFGCPNPVFYNEFALFLHAKNMSFWGPFWLHLGPSCSQNPIIYNEFQWF